jgi:hypothetical protein
MTAVPATGRVYARLEILTLQEPVIEVAPPIPPDADLRHMPGYMIDVQSLLGSDLAALGDPAANWYALLTWCAAFHQVPAGSLPDDDPTLAYLVRLGRDVRTWRRMRAKGAMRGWVKHSDGRLYHPVVTKTVLSLLGKSRAGKVAAEAKLARKNGQVIENATTASNDRSTTKADSLQQDDNNRREGKGKEEKVIVDSALGQEAERQSGPPDLLGDGPKPPAKKAPRSKPRTRLDPEFQLIDADRQYARDRGWNDRVIDAQVEKFKNHHIGKGNTMADWRAAWRTWVGNGYDFRGGRPGPGGSAPNRADTAIEGMMRGLTEDDYFARDH